MRCPLKTDKKKTNSQKPGQKGGKTKAKRGAREKKPNAANEGDRSPGTSPLNFHRTQQQSRQPKGGVQESRGGENRRTNHPAKGLGKKQKQFQRRRRRRRGSKLATGWDGQDHGFTKENPGRLKKKELIEIKGKIEGQKKFTARDGESGGRKEVQGRTGEQPCTLETGKN